MSLISALLAFLAIPTSKQEEKNDNPPNLAKLLIDARLETAQAKARADQAEAQLASADKEIVRLINDLAIARAATDHARTLANQWMHAAIRPLPPIAYLPARQLTRQELLAAGFGPGRQGQQVVDLRIPQGGFLEVNPDPFCTCVPARHDALIARR